MAKIAREMVQKAGTDVDKRLDMPARNAAAEPPEKIEPKARFSEFLGDGPTGLALRRSGENAPYVGKFLSAR
jgi:hypothetical protein